MFRDIINNLAHDPLGIMFIAALFILLIMPAALRQLSSAAGAAGAGAGRSARLADRIAAFAAMPSRLLSRLHDGDLRTYVVAIIIGAVFIIAVALAASGMSLSDFINTAGDATADTIR